jgi:hypothetical protein
LLSSLELYDRLATELPEFLKNLSEKGEYVVFLRWTLLTIDSRNHWKTILPRER